MRFTTPSCLYVDPLCIEPMRCILNLSVYFHNGSKNWTSHVFFSLSFFNVSLEYNKYKRRTAFDQRGHHTVCCRDCTRGFHLPPGAEEVKGGNWGWALLKPSEVIRSP